ncbi:hypothetical protein BJ944DRAFT_273617 [Cunninghamella echinulata]|nr:hypothetical protein BJ944DRAFT_273617 [Cunninghamella echinulata]
MLRPAKFLQPFYQLRHYVQHKIADLVVQQQHSISTSIQQIVNTNALPALSHQQPKPLIQGLQKQFPMINKACTPFLRITPSWQQRGIGCSNTMNTSTSFSSHIRHSYSSIGTFRSYSSTPAMMMHHISPTNTTSIFSHLTPNAGGGAFMKQSFGQHWNQLNNMHYEQHQKRDHYEESPIVTFSNINNKDYKKGCTQFKKEQLKCINDINSDRCLFAKETELNKKKNTSTLSSSSTTATSIKNKKEENKINNHLCIKEDDMTSIHSTVISTTTPYFYLDIDLLPPPSFYSIMIHSDMDSKQEKKNPLSQDILSYFNTWKNKQQTYYHQFILWLQFFVNKKELCHYTIRHQGQSLRIYLPKHITHQDQVMDWIKEIKKNEEWMMMPPQWSLHQDSKVTQEPLLPLGPDYFQGLQLFLDQIDDLFDHGPAFSKMSNLG